MGKLVFLDLVDRSAAASSCSCPQARTGEVDVAPRRRRRRDRQADEEPPRRAVARRRRARAALAQIRSPLPDTFHGLTDVEQRYRRRYLDLLMNEETRARLPAARAHGRGDPPLPRRATASSRSRRRSCSRATAARSPAVRHALQRARRGPLPARSPTELYLKRLIVGGLETVYELGKDFRNEGVSFKHNPEFTMLEWYEAYADYRDTMERIEKLVERVAPRRARHDEGHVPRPRDRPEGALAARQARRRARGARPLDAATRPSCARGSTARGVDTTAGQDVGAARRPRAHALRRAALIEPTILYDYPVELSPFARHDRRSDEIVERFECFVGGMELGNAFSELNDSVEQEERFRMQAEEGAGGNVEAEPGDPDYVRGALLRHAADRRARLRHRPARDGARGQGLDPRRHPLPGPARAPA